MSLASLDLTHVLCKDPASVSKMLFDGHIDDDSSYFSLTMALITLSPILLMASGKVHPIVHV